MTPYKTKAHINSLDGKLDDITVLDKIENEGEPRGPYYIVDYKGKLCTAIFNYIVCAYFTDDLYGLIE